MENISLLKDFLLKEKVYESEKQLEWLTEDFIKEREKSAVERKPFEFNNPKQGMLLNYIDYGNHFYTSNNGKRWNWDSGENVAGGNLACGQTKSWYYDVRQGDTYGQAGTCSGGYPYFKLDIYH